MNAVSSIRLKIYKFKNLHHKPFFLICVCLTLSRGLALSKDLHKQPNHALWVALSGVCLRMSWVASETPCQPAVCSLDRDLFSENLIYIPTQTPQQTAVCPP